MLVMLKYLSLLLVLLSMLGCNSETVKPAHKARMFDQTGALAFYSGGDGFVGPVLEPGTHYTGFYDELRHVNCGMEIVKETYSSLTQDGIQFKLDVYVPYSPNCNDPSVFFHILSTQAPQGEDGSITNRQLYITFVRPSIGAAVRGAVKDYKANDINPNKDKIFDAIVTSVTTKLKAQPVHVVLVNPDEIKVNNMDFPETLDKANLERAQVTIEREKAKDQMAKVDAQIQTAIKEQVLATERGKINANKIDEVGKAWARNPAYLQLMMVEVAASKGNMIITSGKESGIFLSPRQDK